jgi:hypothetical protein
MTDHTPGPWKSRKDYDRHWISVGRGKKQTEIASVLDVEIKGDVDTKATEANARLIAAAPELLAVLEQIKAAWDANDSHGVREEIERSFAVIAQAKGG